MSLAADTRTAVRQVPFVHHALRAGIVNYTAAARFLDVGETDAVTAALRRYAEDLPEYETAPREARVTMRSGLGVESEDEARSGAADEQDVLLAVGGAELVDGGSLTGVLATGAVDARALATVLDRLAVEEIGVAAAGVAGDTLLVTVERRDGPDAVRLVEDALSAVPEVRTPTD
ncbi:DUF7523 family protein [Halococcus saccharolyticus]|uniref:Uncharacterized protein n=1 Tax=Halococcus saccharolyticus DSM 5350 TaxID=1227455 RepID=M0MJC2_9EURY|nr:hypothetical protein [Halococcus saccharolyticus]EMA45807.1 hypothetical protein C449_06076 [Halococcus saccharolyticus DSM 5350]